MDLREFKFPELNELLDIDACRKHGLSYFHQGQDDVSRLFLQRGLTLEPSDQTTVMMVGLVLLRGGVYDGAITFLRRAVALNPNRWQASMYLAMSLIDASGVLQNNFKFSGYDNLTEGLERLLIVAEASGNEMAIDNLLKATHMSIWTGVIGDDLLDRIALFSWRVARANRMHHLAIIIIATALYRRGKLLSATRIVRYFIRGIPRDNLRNCFDIQRWAISRSDDSFFNTLRSTPQRLDDHADVKILIPGNTHEPIVFFSCDDAYWHRFGDNLLNNLRNLNKRGSVHVVNPEPGTMEIIQKRRESDRFLSYSVENVDLSHCDLERRRNYFAGTRFSIALELMRRTNRPITQVDADVVFNTDPWNWLAAESGWEIAFLFDPRGRGTAYDHHASFLSYMPTPKAAELLDLTSRYISWHFRHRKEVWMLDQVGSCCCYDYLRRHGCAPVARWMDITDAPIITFLEK